MIYSIDLTRNIDYFFFPSSVKSATPWSRSLDLPRRKAPDVNEATFFFRFPFLLHLSPQSFLNIQFRKRGERLFLRSDSDLVKIKQRKLFHSLRRHTHANFDERGEFGGTRAFQNPMWFIIRYYYLYYYIIVCSPFLGYVVKSM